MRQQFAGRSLSLHEKMDERNDQSNLFISLGSSSCELIAAVITISKADIPVSKTRAAQKISHDIPPGLVTDLAVIYLPQLGHLVTCTGIEVDTDQQMIKPCPDGWELQVRKFLTVFQVLRVRLITVHYRRETLFPMCRNRSAR